MAEISSTPLPQLLPHLHERLDLARAGKVVVDQAAIPLRLLVDIPNRRQAEMRQVVTEFLEVLAAEGREERAVKLIGGGVDGQGCTSTAHVPLKFC